MYFLLVNSNILLINQIGLLQLQTNPSNRDSEWPSIIVYLLVRILGIDGYECSWKQ